MNGQTASNVTKPIAEWVLGAGVLAGMFLPWIEAGRTGLSGISIATAELATGVVPGEIGLSCLLLLLMTVITLLLPLSPKGWWVRAFTVLIAGGSFAMTVVRMGESSELAVKLGAARPGLGLLVTGGFMFLSLIVTIVSVIGESVRRRNRAPQ